MLNPKKAFKATTDYLLSTLLAEHLAPPPISEEDWHDYLDAAYADNVDWCDTEAPNGELPTLSELDIPDQVDAKIEPMQDNSFSNRVLAALRREFGGHAVKKK